MNTITIMLALMAVLMVVAWVQAKAGRVLRATPILHSTYKLRTGQEVKMSESQQAIANGQMRLHTPQEIARLAKSITVKIETEIDSEDHRLGTGFFVSDHLIQTVYHTVRDASISG